MELDTEEQEAAFILTEIKDWWHDAQVWLGAGNVYRNRNPDPHDMLPDFICKKNSGIYAMEMMMEKIHFYLSGDMNSENVATSVSVLWVMLDDSSVSFFKATKAEGEILLDFVNAYDWSHI